ncbi:MAG: DnaA/Hda family protein [Deltaproteobacteria bacterium]|nr:DnaA/Hda family protein [Deltaproteobacteria bacterium]
MPRQAVFSVPNKFIAQWVEENYTGTIRSTLERHFSIHPDIVFTTTHPSDKDSKETTPLKRADSTLGHDIDPLNTFDAFIPSGCNQLAYSSALTMAENAAPGYNPLYLYSPASLGKTHLLHAIANRVLLHQPASQVLYFSTAQAISPFTSTFTDSARITFGENKDCADCLLVDDIHLLADRPDEQKDLLYIFDLFMEFNKRLGVTANVPPNKIKRLIPQLKSRLESGLITEIGRPDQKTRMEIIQKKLDQYHLSLSEDVRFFLTGSIHDLKRLDETIERLKARHALTGDDIDISAIQSILSEAPFHALDIPRIQSITARYFNIPTTDLLSDKKLRHISYPRQVAIYLSRSLTDLSLKAIGKAFGNKHHTSILYAIHRIENEKKRNKRTVRDINALQKRLMV